MDHFTHPYLVDPFFGPSPHARFETGGIVGCDCRKETFRISYDATYDELQKKNPDLSNHNLRLLTAQMFRPWYREDIASVHNEETGKVTEVEFEITTQGDFYFPSRGKTDTEMDDNTRKLNPREYHPSDTLTNKAVHDAVAQGATHIVTSYFRPNQDHRDFVEFTIDPTTRKGKLRVINASLVTGKTHEFNEMSGVATKIFKDLQIYTPTDRVFIATNKEINTVQLERSLGNGEQKDYMMPTRQPIVDTVVRDSWVTTKNALDYVFRKNDEPVVEIGVSGISVGVLLKDKRYRAAVAVLETTPPQKQREALEETWKKTAQTELRLSEGQSEKLLQQVVETHEVMTGAAKVMTFAGETKVALGAAFYALDVMAFNAPKQNEDAISDINEAAQPLVFEVPELDEPASEKRIDTTTRLQVVEFVRSIDALPVEKQIEKIMEEKQKAIETIARVWEKATELVRSVDQTPEPEPEKQLSVAIAVWTILKLSNYLVALDRLEQMVRKLQGLEKPEGLVPREPAPWILLSIIWYLAQIREQGLVQTKAVPKKKKQKQSAPVIIYAFSS